MTSLLELHDQDMLEVMIELGDNDSPGFPALYNLVTNAKVYLLDEKQLGPLRRKGTFLSRNEWGSPVLTNEFPLVTLPSTKEIKRMLNNDITDNDSYRFFPSRGSQDEDFEAIVELLDNIGNTQYSKPGSILRMLSPSFERLCEQKVDWSSDGMLSVTSVSITVSPANDAHDLEYYDNYAISSLLSGRKVWLAFPPLAHNLTALQAEYQAISKDDDHVTFDNLSHFQHGIAIIQQANQTLVLPPFWIAMSLTTQTAVSCAYNVATATVFVERIKMIDNFLVTSQFWPMGSDYGQQRIVIFATVMIDHLQAVLEDKFPQYNATKVIAEVCRAHEMLRGGLRRVLDAIEDKVMVEGLESKFREAWLKFLEQKRKKIPACRLCNVRIYDMPTEGTPKDRLRQHFIDSHCLRK